MTDATAGSSRLTSGAKAGEEARSREVRQRWLLASPALFLIFIAALGPLAIMLVYSFLKAGSYGGVVWEFSLDGWTSVFVQRDIFSDQLSIADAHVQIFWRSIQLSLLTTITCMIFGLPTAYFIATRPKSSRNFWLFLITIPFWTNLLIRTFAIMEVIRNEGILNSALMALGGLLSLSDRRYRIAAGARRAAAAAGVAAE